MQEEQRKKDFSLRVVDTPPNLAEVGKRSLDMDRLDSLMLQMPLRRGEGRQAAVPIAAFSFQSAVSSDADNVTC